MPAQDGRTGFWAPGCGAFADGLAQQARARLAPLRLKLKTAADPARRAELKRLIAAIKTEFRARRRHSSYSLFAKTPRAE